MSAQRQETAQDATGGRCGTYAGYQAHQKEGTPFCAPCRKAVRDYQRQRRATSPARQKYDADYTDAYHRALSRLVALHPALFQALLAEERDRAASP